MSAAPPFDTPLTAPQAYSLAKPFLSGCPSSNPPITFPEIPPLMASFASDNHDAGAEVQVMWGTCLPCAVTRMSSRLMDRLFEGLPRG